MTSRAGEASKTISRSKRATKGRSVAQATDTILQRVAAGEAGAAKECLDRFGGLVWSLARRLSYNESEAEDAVQEIFLDVWKSSGRYDPGIASETAFVAMIARRRLIDRRRRQSRRPTEQVIPDGATIAGVTAGEQYERCEEAKVAAEALSELTEDQQRVLKLSVYHGLSHEKISRATGLPLGTVKTHARRGLMRIRERLANDEASSNASSNGGAA